MLTTAQIQDHFGIKLTAEFIENTLKVPPTEREKRACRWTEDAVPKIGEALAKYAVKKGGEPVGASAPAPAPAPAAEAADDNSDLF